MKHAESTVIERPSSNVWELAGHPEGWQAWAEDIRDVEVDGDGPAGLGAAFSYQYRGRAVTAEVAEFSEGSLFGFRSPQGWYQFSESIALEDLGERTAVTFTMGFEPVTWWGRVLAVAITPLRSVLLGRPLKKGLKSLKDTAERRTVSGA